MNSDVAHSLHQAHCTEGDIATTPPLDASAGSNISHLVTAAEREAKITEYLRASPNVFSMVAVCFPNAFMLWQHSRGKTHLLVSAVLKSPLGVRGLFTLPFIGLALEKSFYDSAMSVQGIDPSKQKPGRENEGFPSGGHALPSLSVFPVRNIMPW